MRSVQKEITKYRKILQKLRQSKKNDAIWHYSLQSYQLLPYFYEKVVETNWIFQWKFRKIYDILYVVRIGFRLNGVYFLPGVHCV